MYDRLTKWEVNGCASVNGCSPIDKDMANAINRLCEIEDKICEGKFVELPCAVGDIVYAPHWHWGTDIKGDIMPYQITNITITQNKKGIWTKKYRAMEIQNGRTIDWQLNFEFDEIGKTVFLTREEAERALERSENGK